MLSQYPNLKLITQLQTVGEVEDAINELCLAIATNYIETTKLSDVTPRGLTQALIPLVSQIAELSALLIESGAKQAQRIEPEVYVDGVKFGAEIIRDVFNWS